MVTQLATGLCQYIIAFRIFKFNFNLKFTIVTTAFVIISVAATYFASMLDYNRWVVVCGSAVLCVLVAVALRVLDLRSALNIIKESLAKKKEQQ